MTPAVMREGIAAVAALVAGMLFVLAIVDIAFAALRWRPVGALLQDWAGRYPRYALGVMLLLGALLGHLFLNR